MQDYVALVRMMTLRVVDESPVGCGDDKSRGNLNLMQLKIICDEQIVAK